MFKTYENKPLLQDVSLEIERGEIVSFLGSSGSGKTTLLRIVAGLEKPEAGRIVLEGRDLSQVPVHRRGIVLMFRIMRSFPIVRLSRISLSGSECGTNPDLRSEPERRRCWHWWAWRGLGLAMSWAVGRRAPACRSSAQSGS